MTGGLGGAARSTQLFRYPMRRPHTVRSTLWPRWPVDGPTFPAPGGAAAVGVFDATGCGLGAVLAVTWWEVGAIELIDLHSVWTASEYRQKI